VEGESTWRHPHDQVRSVVTILLLAAAGLAVASDQARLVFKIEQGRETLVDLEDNVAASAAVTAGGAAGRAILFAPEGNRAVTALAGLHIDSGFVDKPHNRQDYSRFSGRRA